jgi:predicted nucleic acid-binding Zn ribbon protein
VSADPGPADPGPADPGPADPGPADRPGPAGQRRAAGADRTRLAAEALAEAKADARARGDLPAGHQRPAGGAAEAGHADAKGHGRARREDPQSLSAAIGGLLDGRGWQQQAAMGSVFGRWAEIVGHDLAAHTTPDTFADGELAVTADSTAWATQVRLLAPELIRRLNAELGDGTVRRVKLRGPAPPRRRGGWRVPGSKGPGDTYG